MHSKIISLFFIVSALTGMSTSLGLHHLVVTARRSLEFMARQTDSNPCASICGTVESKVNACITTSCLCSSAIGAGVQACVNCGVANNPTASGISAVENLANVYKDACSSVPGAPTITINLNSGSTLKAGTLPGVSSSTKIVPVSHTIIGPSSPAISSPSTASNVGSTSTTSAGGLPLNSSASPNKIILHWTVALPVLGLAAGYLLVF